MRTSLVTNERSLSTDCPIIRRSLYSHSVSQAYHSITASRAEPYRDEMGDTKTRLPDELPSPCATDHDNYLSAHSKDDMRESEGNIHYEISEK